MEYKIGEVSKILNISKEMIRYYEKQGILKPSRKEDNNYRTYSVMDVFLLRNSPIANFCKSPGKKTR